MNFDELKQKIKGAITTHEADKEFYSRDASIFEITPSAIIFPENTKDIEQIVSWVSLNKAANPELSITARAGGTDMTGGSINNSIVLDVSKHLNKISELNTHNVTTESGVYFRDLEPKLIAQNTIMPTYPVSKAWCAVGGMVGNNCGGEKTLRYGQAIDYVLELDVTLADGKTYHITPLTEEELNKKMAQNDYEGNLYKQVYQLIQDNYRTIQDAKPNTSKNSTGYYLWDVWNGKTFDLTKLFVGSQGTLGIISKIKWRLVPILRGRQLMVCYLADTKQLGDIINLVNSYNPESFELFDQHTLSLALRYLPELISKSKASTLKMLFKFFPELWLMIKKGLPQIVLLAEFTADTQAEAESKAQNTSQALLDKFGLKTKLAKDYEDSQKYWTIRRESYNLLRQHNARKISAPFVEDIIVHPEQLPQFMPQLDEIFNSYPDFTYTIAGHAGDANFHIIPLVDLSIPEHRNQVIEISDKVFALVKNYKGSIAAEHNDGLVRGPFLESMYGEKVFDLFKQVKQIFDPQNIFNPHKKTDADLSFYTEHIKHH